MSDAGPGNTRPCGVCSFTGPLPNANADNGDINNRRCTNDTSIKCTSNAPCLPNGTCQFYFGSNPALGGLGAGLHRERDQRAPSRGRRTSERRDQQHRQPDLACVHGPADRQAVRHLRRRRDGNEQRRAAPAPAPARRATPRLRRQRHLAGPRLREHEPRLSAGRAATSRTSRSRSTARRRRSPGRSRAPTRTAPAPAARSASATPATMPAPSRARSTPTVRRAAAIPASAAAGAASEA